MNKLINVNSYRQWCDNSYHRKLPFPDGKIIFANPEDVKYLFQNIKTYKDKKIILVSAGSDYGIHYQVESPVNADILKMAQTIDYNALAQENEYAKVSLQTANYPECNIKDKFSVKIDRYTINTFHEIPPNIHKWFCANANVNESQIEYIPYGTNVDTEENGILDYYKRPEDKIKLIYANFRINSVERMKLNENLVGIDFMNKQMTTKA